MYVYIYMHTHTYIHIYIWLTVWFKEALKVNLANPMLRTVACLPTRFWCKQSLEHTQDFHPGERHFSKTLKHVLNQCSPVSYYIKSKMLQSLKGQCIIGFGKILYFSLVTIIRTLKFSKFSHFTLSRKGSVRTSMYI